LHKDLLGYLNQFSVKFRYTGEVSTREQAKYAINALKILIPILREKLAPPELVTHSMINLLFHHSFLFNFYRVLQNTQKCHFDRREKSG